MDKLLSATKKCYDTLATSIEKLRPEMEINDIQRLMDIKDLLDDANDNLVKVKNPNVYLATDIETFFLNIASVDFALYNFISILELIGCQGHTKEMFRQMCTMMKTVKGLRADLNELVSTEASIADTNIIISIPIKLLLSYYDNKSVCLKYLIFIILSTMKTYNKDVDSYIDKIKDTAFEQTYSERKYKNPIMQMKISFDLYPQVIDTHQPAENAMVLDLTMPHAFNYVFYDIKRLLSDKCARIPKIAGISEAFIDATMAIQVIPRDPSLKGKGVVQLGKSETDVELVATYNGGATYTKLRNINSDKFSRNFVKNLLKGPKTRMFEYNGLCNSILSMNTAAIPKYFTPVDQTKLKTINTKTSLKTDPDNQLRIIYLEAFQKSDDFEKNLCYLMQASQIMRQVRRKVEANNTYTVTNYRILTAINNYAT